MFKHSLASAMATVLAASGKNEPFIRQNLSNMSPAQQRRYLQSFGPRAIKKSKQMYLKDYIKAPEITNPAVVKNINEKWDNWEPSKVVKKDPDPNSIGYLKLTTVKPNGKRMTRADVRFVRDAEV